MNLGDLRRTTPISTVFGYDRGTPVDRIYMEDFLGAHAVDVKGRVLEFGDNAYTLRFGGAAVTRSDVFHRHPGHPHTTFVGDLANPKSLPPDTFDCIIFTQVLHLIFDMPAAVATLHRSLRPGGVLLATVPWGGPIDRGEWRDSWYWSVSPLGLQRLLAGPFREEDVATASYGNVLAGAAFLYGLAAEDLDPEEMKIVDPCSPIMAAARARKVERRAWWSWR